MLRGTKRPLDTQDLDIQNWVADVVQPMENIDIVKDGVLYPDNPIRQVLVGSESDLDQLGEYAPGTLAFTAGYLNIWQKSVDGTFVAIVAEEPDAAEEAEGGE